MGASKSEEKSFKRKGGKTSSFSGDKFNKKQKIDDSNLSSSALKRQAKKERQSQRRHADIVVEAKALWNKIRVKSNTIAETQELMNQIMNLIQGKVNEIALQHDASRVVQAAIQFGNDQQRYELLKEICDADTKNASSSSKDSGSSQLVELSKIQYAHFVCLKFIKYCNRKPECVKLIVKSFKGSIPKLSVHSVGARVVESLFLNFPPSATNKLKQEFYGPHFNLFSANASQDKTPTLTDVIASAKTDTQKESALKFYKEIVTKGTTKGFFGYKYFQDIVAEYLDYLSAEDPNEIRNSIASTLVDHSILLLSTRSGSKVVAICASYATPKDRKRICKSLKGYTRSSLLHRDAYLALVRLIQVTDDTVSIHKSILNEILSSPKGKDGDDKDADESPFLELALSDTASKLFIWLLVEDDDKRNRYFDPYEQSLLCNEAYYMEAGKKVPTSKKDNATRRKELLQHMNDQLVNVCIQHTDELLMSLPGSRIIKEVYDSDISNSKEKELVKSLVAACQAGLGRNDNDDESVRSNDDGDDGGLFEDPTGHRSVKNLFICDATKDEPAFSIAFVERFSDEQLLDVAKSNRGAFVLTALTKVPKVQKQVKQVLNKHKKELKKLQSSSKGGASSGYDALLAELK